jgi:hypothetical protein
MMAVAALQAGRLPGQTADLCGQSVVAVGN